MAVTSDLSVDTEVATTADTQKEAAVDEVLSSGGVDVSAEANVSPDDILENATPRVKAKAAQEGPDEEEIPEEEPAEDAVQPEQEASAEEAQEQLGKRASKRVQDAVNRAKEAELRMAEMQAQSQQQIAYLQYQVQQQMVAQQQAMREQQEFYRRQEQARGELRQREELEKLTPVQRIEREWLEKAKQAALTELRPELQKTQNELAQERAYRAQAMRAAQERQQLQQYKTRADVINREVLFKELDQKDLPNFNDKGQELLLTWGTAAGEEPEQAAKGLKQFLDNYFQARLKAQAKVGAKLKQSINAPKTVPAVKGATPKNADGKEFKFNRQTNKWGFF